MEATLNPYLTLCTEEGSASEAKIASRVQTAIENGGQCIYNVNDGSKYDLPRILPLKECINEIPEGEHFTGWVGFEKIAMVDLSLAHKNGYEAVRSVLDEMERLSVESRDLMAENERFEPASPDCTSVAIRVDNPDGTWFEYIVSDTVASNS